MRLLTSSATAVLKSFPERWAGVVSLVMSLLSAVVIPLHAQGAETIATPARSERYLAYTNEVHPKVPWSIHVVKIDRAYPDIHFSTTLGGGDILGMENVTAQLKSLPPELGQPLAAINGDFFEQTKEYPGRPRDLHLMRGEVVTAPTGHTCFWIDPQGQPQMTNVFSRFRVVWSGGKTTPMGLNTPRTNDAVVLYTSRIGSSTRTKGGIEYTLEQTPAGSWLPLRVGQTYEARVRTVHNSGNNPVSQETLVLSVGPDLISSLPSLRPGATLQIVTETLPNLAQVEVAIGGGPALLQNGQRMQWKGWIQWRHPRSAIGWNAHHIFLVEVDGRQIDFSLGMTFTELAEYMLHLGCEQAMNFDGGGSATLWALGSVRNNPSEGQERPSPNALVVLKRSRHQGAK